ncbi:oligosaccharide flippase family protein [Novosphingobium sp. Gsoil 351]|uniref:oligosaccharide flippase family protein n=1 Tax=Novosphingobium sp. Gsoil 351 TaxID=2675225 RepID=UPI001E629FD3|nr:oligosaccharide flippase family protein [Novosphingobium sp. Gsoil 351]
MSCPLASQLGWVVVPFGVQQVIRLGTQIALARMLAPEMFGLMLLVNTLRTGAELLSDIGIGQSVVRSPNGDARNFLNVAWTLQVLRGAGLTALMLGLAYPIASIYRQPELLLIILTVSPIFLISGLMSPSLFVAQRQFKLKTRAIYDILNVVFACAITIALAWIMPNVWALVLGLMISTLFGTVISFFLGDGFRPRLAWDRSHVAQILHFGKWIFFSTALYYAATSFDRMYFVGVLSLTLAGVFGIARTFSDMLGALAQRAGAYIVFPKVVALVERRSEVAPRLRATRRKMLMLVAIVTGLGIAMSDEFILLAYDARYHAAAFMIPVLLVSMWFGILSTFADSMLMGCGRPAPGAWANGAKFGVMLVGLPHAVARGDMMQALAVLIAAEVARWLFLIPASRAERFAKVRDDVFLTGLLVFVAVGAKVLLGFAGIVPNPAQWWAMRELLYV